MSADKSDSERKTDTAKHPDYVLEPPERVLSTMNQDGSRRWMYPRPAKGAMLNRRKVVGWGLIAAFFLMPVVKLNGEPLMWLDVIHRRFALFGRVFYATDTVLLMLLGLILVLAVVWVTALLGRVWCGWGCPQTVYMEFIFRPIERWIEGKEVERARRDREGWTSDRVWRVGVKYVIYTVIAAAMAHTFVAYFVSWNVLLKWMTGSPAERSGFFLMMGVTTALIVFDFGYFREQMCTIACPYARLQSVLLDRDSLIVSYDPVRGEPRGRRVQAKPAVADSESQELKLINLGDCVDCGACVRTCPTGIDIRDGLQLECIGCTQCIDACDAIMIGVGKAPGLVRYTSQNVVEGRAGRVLRPRIMLYTLLLLVLSGVFVYGVSQTSGLDVEVVRVTGAPFTVLPDGDVSNHFKVRVQNRTPEQQQVLVRVESPPGARVRGQNQGAFEVKTTELKRVDIWIVLEAEGFEGGKVPAKLRIGDGGELDELVDVTLLGPLGAKTR